MNNATFLGILLTNRNKINRGKNNRLKNIVKRGKSNNNDEGVFQKYSAKRNIRHFNFKNPKDVENLIYLYKQVPKNITNFREAVQISMNKYKKMRKNNYKKYIIETIIKPRAKIFIPKFLNRYYKPGGVGYLKIANKYQKPKNHEYKEI